MIVREVRNTTNTIEKISGWWLIPNRIFQDFWKGGAPKVNWRRSRSSTEIKESKTLNGSNCIAAVVLCT